MEELYKDINRWIEEQRPIQQEKEVGKLADILVEGFMSQVDEPVVEEVKDQMKEEGSQG